MSGIIGGAGSRSGIIGGAGRIYVGSFTADMNASPSTAISGVGFKPTVVEFIAINNGLNGWSWGIDDGTLRMVISRRPSVGDVVSLGLYSLRVVQEDNSNKVWRGYISAFGNDGFTVFQQLTDYPHTANAITIRYIAYK
jgi:hypothetical protein